MVLLPQQVWRDAGAHEFLVNPSKVGLRLTRRAPHRRAVQLRLELFVAQLLPERPLNAGNAREQHERADRPLADPHGEGDLRVAPSGFKVQAQVSR